MVLPLPSVEFAPGVVELAPGVVELEPVELLGGAMVVPLSPWPLVVDC
ncbi:MAG TPA: hypothetical protein VN668_07000 [Stellaceae bacterium]|nr:hypothetical protein [Stellaceae bacterium]